LKNWNYVSVSDRDLDMFTKLDVPIAMPFGIVPPNGGVILIGENGKQVPAMFCPVLKAAKPLTKDNPIRGMRPANKDLHLAYEHLQNPNVLIVMLDGLFGTGKTSTVMSHACGNLYDNGFKMVITKPHVPVGKSYGHLPGTIDEKTDLEFQSFYQYIERYKQGANINLLKMGGQLEIAPLEYIRGRDYPNSWVIVDEAQNLSPEEAVTLAGRLADGSKDGQVSKLILLGDTSPWQKDTRHKVDGFTYLKNLLQDEGLVGHTEMRTVEHVLRGKVAKALARALMREGQPV
jgi:predicted ribonuclease YlaK